MKKIVLCIMVSFFYVYTFGQELEQTNETQSGVVPLSMAFHNIGWNVLHSVTYHYGLNFIGAGLGTWAFVETGFDWKWRNIAYENDWLSRCGIPSIYIGYIVPGLAPIAAYIAGRIIKDRKLQITGLALAQSLAITLGMQSLLKMTTGRPSPGLVTALDETRTNRTDDFSREFKWFNMNLVNGWPSGHTANAFSAAAAIAELYHDNLAVQIGVWSYAALMGLSISVSCHWASEVFAGALIGYVIGKTVGRSYRNIMEKDFGKNKLVFYVTNNALGIIIRI